MTTHAIAIVHEEAGVYGIAFPDFPGCIAAGDDLDDVLRRGAAALAAYIDSLLEDGEPVPTPRSLDRLKADPVFRDDAEGGMIVALPVDLSGNKIVPLDVALDEKLIAAVDRAAERAGLSRSDFLAAAAKAKLGA
ncbi:type II toxin-antitoxin system HicB family antitoxin [Rhodovulum sp. PH10]|uniref:type II toxin-antitoxin system HicB family antitoxin n=1 Tax=Rhodovulum sp. PH10 TaxID=1187851 RepID=UPI00058FC2BB|nr:type II toxin-antitoxin system HicB family antitoxin [Rhodovulum sp. PH10]